MIFETLMQMYYDGIVTLTLQEAASGMHPEWQGGGGRFLTQFLDITLIEGQK